jgi:hypothetical protein
VPYLSGVLVRDTLSSCAVDRRLNSTKYRVVFISQELVILLLQYKADVNLMNGEGRTAADVCKTRDVQRLVEAAQRSERHERERTLLTAAKEGRVDDIQELVTMLFVFKFFLF